MKIQSISNIERINDHIHYRRKYNAILNFIDYSDSNETLNIEFAIEHDATGKKKIYVTFLDKLNYPLLPATQKTIKFITLIDEEGLLK